jgi:ornithine cyclodeaminase
MMYEGKLPPITEGTSLGDIICGTKEGRTSKEERICFVTGGMPVWDVGWGYELYTKAKELGLGQTLRLWDSPYLD